MDRDTTGRQGAHWEFFSRLQGGEVDILLGTQMVALGWDVPGVTLVGVVAADLSLNLPDFRAAERTFQLVTQAAGRAGRGEKPGQVVVQAYNPEHYALVAAARHDYEGFYAREVEFRRRLGYPPFCRLLQVLLQGKDEMRVALAARAVAEAVGSEVEEVLGPAPALISRLRGLYRWQVICKDRQVGRLQAAADRLRECLACKEDIRGVQVEVDMDPGSLM